MDKRLNWNEIIRYPLQGWRLVAFLAVAFLPWAILKQAIQEQGIILGGIPTTLLLFGLAWFLGILVALVRHWANSGRQGANMKVLLALALLAAITMGWLYHQSGKEARWDCLQKIKYIPSNGGFYRLYADEFQSQKEALDYCLEIKARGQYSK